MKYTLHQSQETEREPGNTGRTGRLRTYVENQAMLEPILLYRASKCKQIKEYGSEDCLSVYGLIFLPFYKIIASFFLFYVKMM